MAITITLTAAPGAAAGVDFDTFMTSYFADLVPTGWPYILGGASQFEGDQIVLLGDPDGAATKAIVLDGDDFNYYFNGHTLSGTLTTVRLATLGDSYNPADGSFDMAGGHIANISTPVEISGLDISNAVGVRGDLHEVIHGLMGGGHDGGGFADPTALKAAVAAQAHNVVGSTGADAHVGTGLDDTVRGNGGNDVFDGKGGVDTAVFSGKRAQYTISLDPSGTIVVTDNRGGSPDGTDTLKGFEFARFSDATVNLSTIEPTDTNEAPHSLGLSGSSVSEAAKIGTSVGRLSATDPDGDAISYSLSSNPGGFFKIVGSALQVAKALDYETAKSHTVTVEATDAHGLKTTRSFTINVGDVDETPSTGKPIVGTARKDVLTGGKAGDDIRGLGGNDKLHGLGGHDRLDGGDGNDTMNGGTGSDALVGGKGNDTASYEDAAAKVTVHLAKPAKNKGEAAGDSYSSVENVKGSDFADRLIGDDGDNVLTGGKGEDSLAGGKGADTLYGQGGADLFVFKSLADSGVAKSGRDVIVDFSQAHGDRIDLSLIDARAGSKKINTFTFVGENAFSGAKGELRFDAGSKRTFVYGDVDGDGKADFAIQLTGKIALEKADFVL